MKNKIIFLDIDGVLNHEIFYQTIYFDNPRDVWGQTYCPNSIKNLKKIIDQTGAQIVVSSTHRHGSKEGDESIIGLQYMQGLWTHRNYPGKIIDITPYYHVEKGPNKRLDSISQGPSFSIPRGYEIQDWLKGMGFYHNPDFEQNSKIENYVILDDDNDMLFEQKNNFIEIDRYYGLTEKDADQAIKILNNEKIKHITK